jgi:hypothetical protein
VYFDLTDSTFGPHCYQPKIQVQSMVKNENVMLKKLLKVKNVRGNGSVKLLKTSMESIWLSNEEIYSGRFLGKNFLNMTVDNWRVIWEVELVTAKWFGSGVKGLKANLGLFTMIFLTFVLPVF